MTYNIIDRDKIKFGTRTQVTELDGDGSSVSVVEKVYDNEVTHTMMRYRSRIKVKNKHDEMVEILAFIDLLDEKRKDGTLVTKDSDPSNYPSFVMEIPSVNIDDGYYIVRNYTVLVV